MKAWFWFICASTLLWAQTRMIPHITRAGGGFVTEVILENIGDDEETLTLLPFTADGEALNPVIRILPPHSARSFSLEELTAQWRDISHFRVMDARGTSHANVLYRWAEGDSSPAHLPESDLSAIRWRVFPGDWRIAFDGLAVVNAGPAATSIWLDQFGDQGVLVASRQLSESLAPNAKALYVVGSPLGSEFEPPEGTYFELRASEPLALTALRGTIGAAPGFLWENAARPLAAVWPPKAPEPPTGAAIPGLTFLVDWEDPRALPQPVSTNGWEDSAYISADGTTLYFGYTPLDFQRLNQGEPVVTGPDREGQKGLGFDIYEARIAEDRWEVANSSTNNPAPDLHEAAIGVNRDQGLMAYIRFEPLGDIFFTRREDLIWGPPERLPEPVNTPCIEDNPHLSPEGNTLFFDSNRADNVGSSCHEEGSRNLFVTRLVEGSWSVPEPIVGAPNQTMARNQVFVTEDEAFVYWTAQDPECQALNCIFRAKRQDDGSYAEREVVARPAPLETASNQDAIALGEISITADGRYFYFVYLVQDTPDHTDISIGVARARQ